MSSNGADRAPAITCSGIGKAYQLYRRRTDRLKQVLFGGVRQYHRDYWVLRDINLSVRRGECLGIVGRNGAGKTTLLQLLCGITQPTIGSFAVNGRIAPILALGAGFDGELTGRENALIGGAILGLPRVKIVERMESIVAFAGIGDFIDQPVKLYSSGMGSRLAFAICAHADADILVIDEALAVGDEIFRRRCLRFIDEFRHQGTLLLVSHEMDQIEALCDRVIWLDGGRVRASGAPAEVLALYRGDVTDQPDDTARFSLA